MEEDFRCAGCAESKGRPCKNPIAAQRRHKVFQSLRRLLLQFNRRIVTGADLQESLVLVIHEAACHLHKHQASDIAAFWTYQLRTGIVTSHNTTTARAVEEVPIVQTGVSEPRVSRTVDITIAPERVRSSGPVIRNPVAPRHDREGFQEPRNTEPHEPLLRSDAHPEEVGLGRAEIPAPPYTPRATPERPVHSRRQPLDPRSNESRPPQPDFGLLTPPETPSTDLELPCVPQEDPISPVPQRRRRAVAIPLSPPPEYSSEPEVQEDTEDEDESESEGEATRETDDGPQQDVQTSSRPSGEEVEALLESTEPMSLREERPLYAPPVDNVEPGVSEGYPRQETQGSSGSLLSFSERWMLGTCLSSCLVPSSMFSCSSPRKIWHSHFSDFLSGLWCEI